MRLYLMENTQILPPRLSIITARRRLNLMKSLNQDTMTVSTDAQSKAIYFTLKFR